MKERLRAMNEQKVFLCDQLKALMKRNKILQVSFSSPISWKLANRTVTG
jgi:hypothetical protein